MNTPPPLPQKAGSKNKRLFLIIALAVVVVAAAGYFVIHSILASGITSGLDNQFGDQHLKTAVALIELHKTRYGKYPATLQELTFTGEWDQIALQSVSYYSNPAGTAYFVEVKRGWVAKPKFTMPPEFWQGTGYSAALQPEKP
ncbi:MAG: hypothetical protein WCD79_19580 [Chthoniobacteraceae bacterium]